MRQISEHLQDALSTKLIDKFIKAHKSQLFERLENLAMRLYCSLFLLQHFEKLGVNLIPESICMNKECGARETHRALKSRKIRTMVIYI